MAERFLEEQLARIRRLAEQMSQVQHRVAETAHAVARDRDALRQSPLHDARDLRVADDPYDPRRRRS
jgi:hypothetical protein